jgi:hypothetical protein
MDYYTLPFTFKSYINSYFRRRIGDVPEERLREKTGGSDAGAETVGSGTGNQPGGGGDGQDKTSQSRRCGPDWLGIGRHVFGADRSRPAAGVAWGRVRA